ncbi:MAG: pyruvate kinase [Propionibacteriaceae bacterium]|jgi:pyruvate kinase|nr:pyruvate kinase [Propionibacteriaceae bacterium]
MRRVKIVCTLGPAVSGEEQIAALIEAGMDVARLNMSHGDHAEHSASFDQVRAAALKADRPVTILADLQGPKIRLGRFAQPPVVLKAKDRFTITTDDVPGDQERASTSFKGLPGDVRPGETVLIDDGRIELRVERVDGNDVVCQVVTGGPVSDHKGINLPGVPVSVPALSDKDADDLRWALAKGVDMVALSFVRNADDILPVHAIMDQVGRRVPVIAKIEKPQAVNNLEAIVDAFDALMVARGDLGVEMPFEDVPLVQKQIIHAARTWAKPVIVATQMLESMITAPRPTRAEASDVANAVRDGADAVMLSGETSVGRYPDEAVKAMDKIIRAIEEQAFSEIDTIAWDPHTTSGVVAWGAADIARRLDIPYIVAFSRTGDTARRLARLRTRTQVLCFTPSVRTRFELGPVWGIRSFLSRTHQLEPMLEEMDAALIAADLVHPGERVAVVYGTPLGITGQTNTVYIRRLPQPGAGPGDEAD